MRRLWERAVKIYIDYDPEDVGRLIIGIVLVVSLLVAAHFYVSSSDSHLT
jgi:hypothetical protein